MPPKVAFNGSMPAANSSSPTASFSWEAADAAPVAHRCRLSLAASSGAVQGPVHAVLPTGPLPGPPLALGQWADCSPPMQLYWLLPGVLPAFSSSGYDIPGRGYGWCP
jgi:hypothetical protein